MGGFEDQNRIFETFSIEKYQKVGREIACGFLRFFKLCISRPEFQTYFFQPEHGVSLQRIKEYLDTNFDYQDVYQPMVRQMKDELENADPVEEGGSDSESSDEDIPAKKKKLLREKLAKIINSNMTVDDKRLKKGSKRGTALGQKRKVKRSSTAKPTILSMPKNTSSSALQKSQP